jgi:hypothetical protein
MQKRLKNLGKLKEKKSIIFSTKILPSLVEKYIGRMLKS